MKPRKFQIYFANNCSTYIWDKIPDKIFEANSSFNVKEHTMRKF